MKIILEVKNFIMNGEDTHQDKYSKQRDNTCKCVFKKGDHVIIQDIFLKELKFKGVNHDSRPASDGSGPRSFLVRDEPGSTYLRNARFITHGTSHDQAE